MPLLFWSHESVDMFLILLFRFLFSEMIYIDKTFLYQTKLPSCTSICLVLFMVVTEHIEILWKLRKKLGPSSLEKKLQLLGFASVSLYIFWFIYLVENSSDQKINVIFLVHTEVTVVFGMNWWRDSWESFLSCLLFRVNHILQFYLNGFVVCKWFLVQKTQFLNGLSIL